MPKDIITFVIHSMVDVITNSSTEIYVIDAKQELEIIQAIIAEKEQEFPTEYGQHVYVCRTNEWEIKDMYGYIDEEEAVKYLTAIGYKIEKPQENAPKVSYITISCERGCMNPSLRRFIESTFTVIEHKDNG